MQTVQCQYSYLIQRVNDKTDKRLAISSSDQEKLELVCEARGFPQNSTPHNLHTTHLDEEQGMERQWGRAFF